MDVKNPFEEIDNDLPTNSTNPFYDDHDGENIKPPPKQKVGCCSDDEIQQWMNLGRQTVRDHILGEDDFPTEELSSFKSPHCYSDEENVQNWKKLHHHQIAKAQSTHNIARGSDISVSNTNQFQRCCFGFGCELRNAVIVANGIKMVLQLLQICIGAYLYGVANSSQAVAMALGVSTVVFFHSSGIFGALHRNKCAIIATSLVYSLSILLNFYLMIQLIRNDDPPTWAIVNIIISALCLYPHVCFLRLLNKGMIDKQQEETVEFVPEEIV